jgi:hypothetical protein
VSPSTNILDRWYNSLEEAEGVRTLCALQAREHGPATSRYSHVVCAGSAGTRFHSVTSISNHFSNAMTTSDERYVVYQLQGYILPDTGRAVLGRTKVLAVIGILQSFPKNPKSLSFSIDRSCLKPHLVFELTSLPSIPIIDVARYCH